MPNPSLAAEGLTAEFVAELRSRIHTLILPGAEAYFQAGETAYSRGNTGSKPIEMAQSYYDYQPCGVSTLGELAAGGEERALRVVQHIFNNTREYLTGWGEKEGYRFPLRRLLLHLALCYEKLHAHVSPETSAEWRETLGLAGENVLAHFNRFQERVPALDNRGFGTGINHVALGAEGVWKAGEVLGRADWQALAGDFNDRLIAYSHPDGYFEEHTNDEREGGPSLTYTPLTAGSAYIIQCWRNAVDRARFARCGALYRSLTDAGLRAMAFADERTNPHGLGPYGLAIHSLTPEGRGFLRMALDAETGTGVLGRANLQTLSRINFELDYVDLGEGALPEPFQDGTFRISMPLGVARFNGWTCGLSAMRALNRVVSPRGDYALDRQNHLYLSHAEAGVILSGAKSKYDPLWSTVRIGNDAYPVRTGTLEMAADRAVAEVFYETFSVELTWTFGAEPRLTMVSDAKGPLTAQLVLEVASDSKLCLDGSRTVELGDEDLRLDCTSVATDTWTLAADRPGAVVWPISPFNPYSAGNKSAPRSRRPLFVAEWTNQIAFVFRAKGAEK